MKLIIPKVLAGVIEPRLASLAPGIATVCFDDEGRLDGDAADAVGMMRWWNPLPIFRALLAAAPELRWVHTPSAGVDHVLIPEIIESEIVLTNSAGAHAIPIAEFVMMYMLTHAKRVDELRALARDEWSRGDDVRCGELFEHTLLIIGLGGIGEELAVRAKAFGMRVVGSRRRPRPTPHVDVVVGEDGWRELLPEADFVVVAAPLTEQTRGMVDAAAFARMKPSAYFINIARGQIVDGDALLDALQSRRIAGAAIDTPPIEPLPADHPLWDAPNTWITPHISYSSPRTRGRIIDIFIDNVCRFRAGEPLVNVVDKQAGY
jgi:phosphoglycerate dehydrogenase-like enzyme